jgi:hypothetical protein
MATAIGTQRLISCRCRGTVEDLREVALQERGQPVADPAAIIDEPASVLDQVLQRPRFLVVRQPRPQLVAVQGEQVNDLGSD